MKKLVVLENNTFFWKGFEQFIAKISPDGYEIMKPDAYELKDTSVWLSMLLAQPEISDVAMQSAFESGSEVRSDDDGFENKKQIEVLLPVIREVMLFRERWGLSPITFHVVYNGENFLSDMKDGDLGKETFKWFKLMMRQQENITVKLYDKDNHKLLYTIKSPIDL